MFPKVKIKFMLVGISVRIYQAKFSRQVYEIDVCLTEEGSGA